MFILLALTASKVPSSCLDKIDPFGKVAIEGGAQELLGNDDIKRLFLGEIPESMKALGLSDA
jgi:hypothetical protein